jgi:membrane protease YdiL (CAAX protease family)
MIVKENAGHGQSAGDNCFLLLAYVLSWIVEIPAALAAYGVANMHVSNGLQTLAQLAPAVAALLTVGWFHGRKGVRALLASVLKGRVPLQWYALALFVPWATQAVAVLLYRITGHALPALGPWYNVPLLTAALALFSVGEELGWRGFFLSSLMDRYAPLTATAYSALFWGFWHLPYYFARHSEGERTGLTYLLFLAGIFPVSAFFTFIYIRTRSVLLCMILHGALNSGAAHWFGPMTEGASVAFGIWMAVLWIAASPVILALVKKGAYHRP